MAAATAGVREVPIRLESGEENINRDLGLITRATVTLGDSLGPDGVELEDAVNLREKIRDAIAML